MHRAARRTAWLFAALSLAAGALAYGALPELMAVRWSESGAMRGFLPKVWGAFLIPLVSALLIAVFESLPRMDPLRENLAWSRREYDTFVPVSVAFMTLIQLALIGWNLGITPHAVFAVMPALGFLLVSIGVLLPHLRRNFFFGIRTPWTVSSDYVWEKTHALAAVLFRIVGAVTIFAALAPREAPVIFLSCFTVTILGLVVYSYVKYRERYLIPA